MDATTKTATFLFAARLAPLAGDDYGLKQYWRFARAFALLLAAVVLLALPKVGAAATPEDQYIRIYGLIQEVDTLHQTGAFAETLTKSQEVHAALRAFQRDYPDWNPRIVTFRLDYLASRIQTMGGQLLPLPPPNAVLAVQQQPARSTQSIVSSSALDQSKAASQLADPMQAANPIQETRSRGPKSAPSAALANQSRLTSAATVQGSNVVPAFAHARVETPEKRKDLGDYRVGDVAKEDIVTPFRLIAIDAPATATLREKEAQRTPAIFRFNPGVIDEVEAELRAEFARTRERFLEEMRKVFLKRWLGEQALASPRFKKLRSSFRQENRLTGLNTNVFTCWARGESDEAIQAEIAARLRTEMGNYIRLFGLPPDIKLGQQVRIVSATNAGEPLTVEQAEKRGVLVPRVDVRMLVGVKEELVASFPTNRQLAAKMLASLLRTNCMLDAELTRQCRAKRTSLVWAGERYEPGDIIVKRGQVINAKAEVAINQLQEKLIVHDLRERVANSWMQTKPAGLANRWLVGGGLSLAFMLWLVSWQLARRRQSRSLLPARIGTSNAVGTVIACPSCDERIIVPSAASNDGPGAQSSRETLRTALLPHLARLLGNKLFQRLLSQRADLVDTQQKAASELAELEERLEKIQAPLQDRLMAYEKRIRELERELAAKGEENRTLTQAKIALVRQHLETERERTVVERN